MSADFFWLTSPCKGNRLLTACLHLRAPSNVNLVKVNLQYFDISVSFQPTIDVHSFHGGHGHGYGYDMDVYVMWICYGYDLDMAMTWVWV